MADQQLKILCGNPRCRAGILIKNPQKYKEAKCPACGYINSINAAPIIESTRQVPVREPIGYAPPELPEILGWLVARAFDESQEVFPLKLGSNVIGRKSVASPSDHMVAVDDDQMSRRHCTVKVKVSRLGIVEYVLQDGAVLADGTWKKSANGTFFSAPAIRMGEFDSIYLSNGNCFRIGTTHLTLQALELPDSVRQAWQQGFEADGDRTVIGLKVI